MGEPGVRWVEWQCSRCLSLYDRYLGVCPLDESPLREHRHSLPFVWLG
jgi:hypothetical protein